MLFAGKAPGLAGVDQINVQVPSDVREGCAVPLTVVSGGRSQSVTISIRSGGGPCIDPPSAGFGQIVWEKSVTSGGTQTDTMTASFPDAPGMQAPVLITPPSFQGGTGFVYYGPFCSVSGYGSLDAGDISASGPGFNLAPAVPSQVNGTTVYRAILQPGAIQPGSFSVSARGGVNVKAFQATIQIGSGVHVTSSFPAGSILSGFKPLTVNWTGGDVDTWVTVELIAHGTADVYQAIQVPASVGTVSLFSESGMAGVPITGDGQVEIVVEVDPDPSQLTTIAVPGLSLGARAAWKYSYHFPGLSFGG